MHDADKLELNEKCILFLFILAAFVRHFFSIYFPLDIFRLSEEKDTSD